MNLKLHLFNNQYSDMHLTEDLKVNEGFLSDQLLHDYLSELFIRAGYTDASITIVSREPSVGYGTFPAEIVSCRMSDGGSLKLRCKYLTGNENNQEGGHRGGVLYESKVYESLLRHVKLPLVRYFGTFYVEEHEISCMVLEYLENGLRLNKSPVKDALERTATWIGAFHAMHNHGGPDFMKNYDEAYYALWVKNVQQIVSELGADFVWVQRVCEYFNRNMHVLLDSPQVIIHGEFYPNNILLQGETVFPVDWESTAIALGEIDLASLTEGWGSLYSERAVTAYCAARWPGTIADVEAFRQRLKMAELYLQLRWLGRYPNLDTWKRNAKKFAGFPKRLARLQLAAMQSECV